MYTHIICMVRRVGWKGRLRSAEISFSNISSEWGAGGALRGPRLQRAHLCVGIKYHPTGVCEKVFPFLLCKPSPCIQQQKLLSSP